LLNEPAAFLVSTFGHEYMEMCAEVIFSREAKSIPVEIVLKYVSDREGGISSKTEENYDEVCSWGEDMDAPRCMIGRLY